MATAMRGSRTAPLLLIALLFAGSTGVAGLLAPKLSRPARTSSTRFSRCLTRLAVESDSAEDAQPNLLDALPKVAIGGLVAAAAFHAPAFLQFTQKWLDIGESVSGDEFWAPLQAPALAPRSRPLSSHVVLPVRIVLGLLCGDAPADQAAGFRRRSVALVARAACRQPRAHQLRRGQRACRALTHANSERRRARADADMPPMHHACLGRTLWWKEGPCRAGTTSLRCVPSRRP
eukprot:6027898-Pleurochrysis_carterae.AAC.9